MGNGLRLTLFWSPRILTILFILFLGLFALDVFDGEHSFWETILGFLIHLIPNFVLVIFLLIAWRWEWVGGVVYLAAGIFYLVVAWGKFHISVYFFISGPLFLVAALFLVGWFFRDRIRTKPNVAIKGNM